MVEKDRWERIRKWAEDGQTKPEGYVPTWVSKMAPPEATKSDENDPPKTKTKPQVERSDQEEFDQMMDKPPEGDDPSDRGVS